MNRFVTLTMIALLVGSVGARHLRIPRDANAAPKTLADQQAENAKKQSKKDTTPAAQPADTPEPTTSPSDAFAKAQANLTQVERRLWANFEKSDDYTKAATDLKTAQDAYDTTFKSSVTKLTGNPDYTSAIEAQNQAEAALAAARTNGDSNIPSLAIAVMEAKKTVHQLESKAAEQDPEVKEAKTKIADAKAAVDALRKGFSDTIKSDPDYVAAVKAVDESRPQKA
ncbi:MAG TPA: hypothetical protein VFE58_15575 [Tepidisphaeraceae bacterium]|jgi:chromosome segregation ATPase|nr:hypothetical protein [Tepidisphaeraceae bacterium]